MDNQAWAASSSLTPSEIAAMERHFSMASSSSLSVFSFIDSLDYSKKNSILHAVFAYRD